ncbi:hypothetical protein LJ737_23800 [Hymenobacter sp. 15J16-1T3B]|uniref:DUF6756 family protein n=1 Tax=Hymenobacter sp. 15J16-1T3B TaxID=2886941 RepID=UPI001D10E0D3|nr:DUF6756 family protein [Hymenobacter sp. 15J16-1T3B]MCC3160282.1 hypothetical protein [Hymenobacter sp. 15J16-1T3B]
MRTDIRQEIERVRQELHPSAEQFWPVGAGDWFGIQLRMERAFREPVLAAKRRPLLWKQLRPELATAVLSDLDGNETTLPKLRAMWQRAKPVFFFAQESVQNEKTWWYQTDAATAWQLLEHLRQRRGRLEEYGFTDRKYRWALFVNHADDVIFCSEPLVGRVRQLGQQAGVRIR